jgi:hypothetical protein
MSSSDWRSNEGSINVVDDADLVRGAPPASVIIFIIIYLFLLLRFNAAARCLVVQSGRSPRWARGAPSSTPPGSSSSASRSPASSSYVRSQTAGEALRYRAQVFCLNLPTKQTQSSLPSVRRCSGRS